MPEIEFETASASETERAGAALALALEPGDVVLVAGELGAGKTTFVRGACRVLGVTERIASPTFVIANAYEGRVRVSHVDLYRLDSLSLEDPALLADYITPESVAFVEWPERAEGAAELGDAVVCVRISHRGEDRRQLEVAGLARAVEPLGQALQSRWR